MQNEVPTQAMPLIRDRPSGAGAGPAGDASVGSSVMTTLPWSSPAKQRTVERHVTDCSPWPGSIEAGLMVQMGVKAVGLVETTARPAPSTATHSVVDRHETPFSILVSSITLRVLHRGVASGSWVITAPPSPSTATQSVVPLHEIAFNWWCVVPPTTSTSGCSVQVGLAAPGSVEITTPPLLSTATHSVEDGHEIPSSGLLSICTGALQVAVDAVGSVVAITSPPPFVATATHSVVDGHEASTAAKLLSTLCRGLHTGVAAVGFAVVRTAPRESAARQNELVGHETVSIPGVVLNGAWWSTSAGAENDSGPVAPTAAGAHAQPTPITTTIPTTTPCINPKRPCRDMPRLPTRARPGPAGNVAPDRDDRQSTATRGGDRDCRSRSDGAAGTDMP